MPAVNFRVGYMLMAKTAETLIASVQALLRAEKWSKTPACMGGDMARLKLVGTVVALLSLIGSIAVNLWLFELVQQQRQSLGELNNQLGAALQSNQTLANSLKAAEQEKRDAQLAADEMKRLTEQRRNQATQSVVLIEKALEHETCVDMPIPDSGQWMYYKPSRD